MFCAAALGGEIDAKEKESSGCKVDFRLLPNPAEKTLEILSNTGPNPWMGRVRRRWDEWGNPIEMEFVLPMLPGIFRREWSADQGGSCTQKHIGMIRKQLILWIR